MTITQALLDHITKVDTPTICNALEAITGDRTVNGSFTLQTFACAFPDMKPIAGFARTATIRADRPSGLSPADAKQKRLDYYRYIQDGGENPSIAVIQDLDDEPGVGAMWGEVNTAVHRGLGCLGCITNGSIRDLDAVDPNFQLLAGKIGPSHADVHVEAFDLPVTIYGMRVTPGTLIHADRHGAVCIPAELATQLPDAIELCTKREAPILKAARSPGFNVDKLAQAMGEAADIH